MTTTTAHRALPVPVGADVPDVPAGIAALAAALDFDLFVITGTRPAAGTLGRVHYDGAGVWSFDTGAAWTNFLTAVPGGTYLLLAGGTMSGALDMGAQQLKNAITTNIRDLRFTANITGAPTINADNGPSQDLTLTGNVTSSWTLSNFSDGESLRLNLIQDGTGGRTIAFPAGWIWPSGAAARPAFPSGAGAKSTLFLDNVGSTIWASLVPDWKT